MSRPRRCPRGVPCRPTGGSKLALQGGSKSAQGETVQSEGDLFHSPEGVVCKEKDIFKTFVLLQFVPIKRKMQQSDAEIHWQRGNQTTLLS